MATRSRKSFIEVQLYGFDELIKKIEEAGNSIEDTVTECMSESAAIQQEELKAKMRKAKSPVTGKPVSERLINAIPEPEIKWNGNACTARVGYEKGKYNPNNPSDGYKAVFINYGTARIEGRHFIEKAQRSAKRKIKKMQEETLLKILGRISK